MSQDRDGDLYDSDMGKDVSGGQVEFDKDGQGNDHHGYHSGERGGAHFSWDTDRDGNVSGAHESYHDR
ncbi:hypothetical protein M1615_00260 [Patescibacteria group bacterium]|nr:hypothetical protein [Patescibacteria group bacterium]